MDSDSTDGERPPYTVTLDQLQDRFNRIIHQLTNHPPTVSHQLQDLYDDLECYDPESSTFGTTLHTLDPQLVQYLFVGWSVSQQGWVMTDDQDDGEYPQN